MKNVAIRSSNVLINGCVFCSEDVTVFDVVSDNVVYDDIIERDINIKGDLIIDGTLHIIFTKTIPTGIGRGIFGAVARSTLNGSLNKNYDKNDFCFINSKNVYVFADNFQVGKDIIAYSPIDKNYYRKIKLKEIYNKLQTNRLLNNTIKK